MSEDAVLRSFMSMPKTLGAKPSKLHCDLGQARDGSLLTIINAPDSANFWALEIPLFIIHVNPERSANASQAHWSTHATKLWGCTVCRS